MLPFSLCIKIEKLFKIYFHTEHRDSKPRNTRKTRKVILFFLTTEYTEFHRVILPVADYIPYINYHMSLSLLLKPRNTPKTRKVILYFYHRVILPAADYKQLRNHGCLVYKNKFKRFLNVIMIF